MDSFADKAVLITGASEGIGAALTRQLVARGAKVSLVARGEAALREVGGPGAVITAGDLTSTETLHAAIENTLAQFGRLDAVINNAGIGLYDPRRARRWSGTVSVRIEPSRPRCWRKLAAPHYARRAGSS
jgi:NAD(P)-dependent dehydrogenase (short-subunit alcohol dehydrogenase family)